MKKNRLVSDEAREEYVILSGKPYPESRRSGKTTGLALLGIGKVMANPGQELVFMGFAEFDKAQYLVGSLGLKFIIFNPKNKSMIYNIFEEVD